MSCCNRENKNNGGCGCDCCHDCEYTCRTVCTATGRVFYFNDGAAAVDTYKAFYGKGYPHPAEENGE